MKLIQFIADLLPTFGRDQVAEDARITREEIKDVTAPAYEQAAEAFKGWKWKSEEVKNLLEIFERNVDAKGKPLELLDKSWKPILDNLAYIEDIVAKTFNEDVAGSGLTYSKATALQFISYVSFVSRYARKLLNYIYQMEAKEYEGHDAEFAYAPAEADYIRLNMVHFVQAFNVVSLDKHKVAKALDALPDITITKDNAETLPATLGGEAALDPFNMRLIPISLNPIYHIRMRVTEWQVKRYHEAREEKMALELKRLNLIKLADNKPDASLQNRIRYIEGRIGKLNYELSKMEKEHA